MPSISNEEWRAVVGYEGLYQVSNRGRVYSFVTNKMLKLKRASTGYDVATLTRERKHTCCLVHRLVLEAFVGPANGRHCNHINFERADNRPENLEWVTVQQNCDHTYQAGRWIRGARHPRAVLSEQDVVEIRDKAKRRVCTQKQLAKDYNVCLNTIKFACRRQTWKHVP